MKKIHRLRPRKQFKAKRMDTQRQRRIDRVRKRVLEEANKQYAEERITFVKE